MIVLADFEHDDKMEVLSKECHALSDDAQDSALLETTTATITTSIPSTTDGNHLHPLAPWTLAFRDNFGPGYHSK